MTVVADASLALKWVLPEEHTEDALALWDEWQDTGELIIAPPIFRPEVTNALHQLVRRGHIGRSDAAEMLDSLISLVESREPLELYGRALILAGELGLSAAYDALYLALAESEGCELWTADRRLVRSVRARFPLARWLADRP